MPINTKCITPDQLTQSRTVRRRRNTNDLDDIDRRVNDLDQRLQNGRQAGQATERFTNQAKISFKKRLKNALRMVSAQALKPSNLGNFNHWLAKNFAVWKEYGQLGDLSTISGEVRQQFIRAQRLFRGDLADTIGNLAIEETIRKNWKRMRQLKKARRISDKDFHNLSVEAVELSYARWAKHYYNTGAQGFAHIQGKYDEFIRFMDDIGLNTAEQNEVLELGRQVADSYHQALRTAQDLGVNANQLENLEFFPRQLTDDVKGRFSFERKQGRELGQGEPVYTLSDGTEISLSQAFTKARNTYSFLIEDEIVLQAFMEANKVFDGLPDGINHINDLLDPSNGKQLNKALFDSLDDEQLEVLTESGILSKVPMTSQEYMKWVSDKFPLPDETDLRSVMETDWTKAFALYRDQLKSATGKSGMVWAMIRNAVSLDGNPMPWGVSEHAFRNGGQTYANFKPLFPTKQNPNAVLTPEMMELFVRGTGDATGRNIPQTYVHPVTSDLFHSMIDMTTNPAGLGAIADVVRGFSSTFKRLAISSPTFITSQVISPMYQMWAAGGNIFEYLPTTYKTMRILKKTRFENKGTSQAVKEVLDNTRRVYRGTAGVMMTEAELYLESRRMGFVNDYVPNIGEEIGLNRTVPAFGLGNLEGFVRMMGANYAQMGAMEGSAKSVADIAKLTKRTMLDAPASAFAWAASEFENSARFSTLKSLTFDRSKAGGKFLDKLNKAGQFATTQTIRESNNLEGAIEFATDYFFMFDDMGRMDNNISDFVIPFWSFISRNPVSQVRAAIRSPIRYGNFLRIYEATNQRERVEEEIGTDITNFTPEWLEDQRPIYWSINAPEQDDGEDRPMVFYLPTRRFDPIGDTAESIAGTADSVLRAAKVLPKKSEINQDATIKESEVDWLNTDTNKMIDNLLGNSYGFYKAGVGALIEREIGTGKRPLTPDPNSRRPTTFFGVRTDPRLRYFLEETLPITQRLNDTNPFGIFGTRGGSIITDDNGDIIPVPAETSITGQPRSDFDKGQYYNNLTTKILGVYGNFFAGTDFIDPMYNGARNIKEVRGLINQMKKEIRFQREALSREELPKERERLTQELEAMMVTYNKMLIDAKRVQEWANNNNLSLLDAYKDMERRNITPPQLTPEQRREITREAVEFGLTNDSK